MNPTLDAPTRRWWTLLRLAAAGNLLLLLALALLGPVHDGYGQAQLALTSIYTVVCAYRSVLPRVDLERYVLVDHPASSVFLGRSAATVAEVCFGLQLGLALHQLGLLAELPWVATAAWLVPAFTATAQAFCWHSILTLDHRTQAVEESLWSVAMAILAAGLFAVAGSLGGVGPWLARAGGATALGFVVFVMLLDIPMYLRRYAEGRQAGVRYLSLAEGARDAWARRVPSEAWSQWRDDAAWLTPYFTAGVWLSLALAFVPRA